ncbi:D-tyrosyl-tRNA(Tyr) deacylase [bacterium]|nr:D-tyrosyl-tRNA(Tyr) deacylase [bacterium]
MRVLLQKVSHASVSVEERIVSKIGDGVLLLVGIRETDTEKELAWMCNKVVNIRIYEDEEGKLNRSLHDVKGAILVVSQFTLYGDARKGRRPSYSHAARPEIAEPLCRKFAQMLRVEGFPVEEGVFGAHMKVELLNDGPVTLMLERESTS